MARVMKAPVWTSDDARPRVLVESADFVKRDVVAQILTRGGYTVQTCAGPEGTDKRCPLAEHAGCEAVAGADVVVHSMRHSDPRNREVLLGLQERYPDVPIVVEVPKPLVDRFPEDFERCHVIPQPMTSSGLLAALDEVLDS